MPATNLAIFGPNLSSVAQRKGEFHVHAEGCPDCQHYGRGRRFGGDGFPGRPASTLTNPTGRVAVASFIYEDIIAESEQTAKDFVDFIFFAPCTGL